MYVLLATLYYRALNQHAQGVFGLQLVDHHFSSRLVLKRASIIDHSYYFIIRAPINDDDTENQPNSFHSTTIYIHSLTSLLECLANHFYSFAGNTSSRTPLLSKVVKNKVRKRNTKLCALRTRECPRLTEFSPFTNTCKHLRLCGSHSRILSIGISRGPFLSLYDPLSHTESAT